MEEKEDVHIDTAEAHKRAFQIIRRLDGLTIGQARYVLGEVLHLINECHLVDVNGVRFNAVLKEFEPDSA